MKRKRIMVIGPSRCGKTSLCNILNNYNGPLRRIPDVIYGKTTIDVPSAYLENTWMYNHVIAIGQDAWCVLLLVDRTHTEDLYSYGFAKSFRCPVIGVISKSDLEPDNEKICLRQLKNAGVQEPYFHVSFVTGTGIEDLKRYLFEEVRRKGQ